MARDSKVPPQGRFQRFRKLAGLSAQLGTDVLTRGVRRLAGADPVMLNKGTAEKIVATLGDLKGAAMKLGQAISMDADLLAPEVRAVLARLQNEAPPMPYETVAKVVEEELGAPPEQRFARFEREPMAAASLGQVHRARLSDGREVAVKVQYPGIADALTSDLDNLGTVLRAISKASRRLDGRAYYQELRDQMLLEVDYRREAALCQGFAQATERLPELCVPKVIDSHTAQRALTLELLPGPTLKEFIAKAPSAPERFRVSRLLIQAVYGPFLLAGEIHSDPHPGNFLVMPDGRLGVLDFGAVKRFSPAFVRANTRVFLRSRRNESLDLLAACREVGFSIDLSDEEAEPLVREILHIAGGPLRGADYDYATDEVTKAMRAFTTRHLASLLRIRPPAEAVMFFRATVGCSQNLRLLAARGNFGAVYDELAALVEA